MGAINRIFLFYTLKKMYFYIKSYGIEGCDAVLFYSCRRSNISNGCTNKKLITSVIELKLDISEIWNNLHRQTKRHIANGPKLLIEIVRDRFHQEFYELYRTFMKRKGFRLPFGFDLSSDDQMEDYGSLFVALQNDQILGGYVCLSAGSRYLLWKGASRRLDCDISMARAISLANRLLIWEAIKDAKESGFKTFDLGGIWDEEKAIKDNIKQESIDLKELWWEYGNGIFCMEGLCTITASPANMSGSPRSDSIRTKTDGWGSFQ